MANAGQLAVILNLKTGAFVGGMQRATGELRNFAGQVGQVHSLASGLLGKLLAFAGVSGGFAGIIAGVSKAAERIDTLAKTADRLGIATESLSGFQYAAEQSGVSSEKLDGALQKMAMNVGQAAKGTGTAAEALQSLGLSAKELSNLAPDRQFYLIAQAMGNLGNQSERMTVTTQIFGKEAAGMVNMLGQGADGLRNASLEAARFGLVISRVDAAKVEEANDAFAKVKTLMTGMFNQLAIKLSPLLTELANQLVGVATAGDGVGATVDNVMRFGVRAVGFFADAWQGLGIIFQAVQAGLTKGLEYVAKGIDQVIRAMEWLAIMGIRVNSLLAAGWQQLGSSFDVMAQGVRVGFSTLVDAIGQRLASMVSMAASAVSVFSDDLSAQMDAVAQKISGTSSTMAQSASAAFTKAQQEATNAAQETAKAWETMFAPIETRGSDVVRAFADGLGAVRSEQLLQLSVLRQQQQASEKVWQGYQKIQQAATARAQVATATAPKPITDEELSGLLAVSPEVRAETAKADAIKVINQDLQRSLSTIWEQGLLEREEFTRASTWAQARDVFGSLEAMTRGVAQSNKTMFQINKVAGIANAIVNTSEGVTKALAKYPPPLGPVMAGIVAAAGAAQVMAIKNTQFGSGGGAPSVAASIPQPGPTGGGVAEQPRDQSTVNGRTMTNQILVIQGEFVSAELLERVSRQARERNILITEVRRA